MATNNGGENNNRKRKGKEVAEDSIMPSLRGNYPQPRSILDPQHPFNAPPIGQSSSQVQRVLHTAAPVRSFLTLPGTGQNFPLNPPGSSGNSKDSIEQILGFHLEHLKNALYSSVDKLAENKSLQARNLKDFFIELKSRQISEMEPKLKTYLGEIDRLLKRNTSWKLTVESLQKRLQELNVDEAGNSDYGAEEEAESSHQAVEPVKLECKVCAEHVSTVMMWPCRHVCVCTTCNKVSKKCPVCKMEKMTTIELCYPTHE